MKRTPDGSVDQHCLLSPTHSAFRSPHTRSWRPRRPACSSPSASSQTDGTPQRHLVAAHSTTCRSSADPTLNSFTNPVNLTAALHPSRCRSVTSHKRGGREHVQNVRAQVGKRRQAGVTRRRAGPPQAAAGRLAAWVLVYSVRPRARGTRRRRAVMGARQTHGAAGSSGGGRGARKEGEGRVVVACVFWLCVR